MDQTPADQTPAGRDAPLNAPRTARVARNTAETRITVAVDLDGTGQRNGSTGY